MPTTHRRTIRRTLLTAGALLTLCPPAAGAAAPPAGSEYRAQHVCSAPGPSHASCMALELVPETASTAGVSGQDAAAPQARRPLERPLTARATPPPRAPVGPDYAAGQKPEPIFPEELRDAYNLPLEPVEGSATQTIALVDAYNDPNAEADLKAYDNAPAIKLSECSGANGCFKEVNQHGAAVEEGASANPFPKSAKELQERETTCKSGKAKLAREEACAEVEEAKGWTVEISTDIDVAHSLCQSCHILLVEADSSSYEDLEEAEETAVSLGATEVSNSWGGSEPVLDSSAFNHPKTVITAAAGDDGYRNWTEAEEASKGGEEYYAGADYPASSPHVVAVGGTELTVTKADARKSETVWNEDPDPEGGNEGAGGGGCSTQFSAPEWQRAVSDWSKVGCGAGADPKRAVADIAADADPYSGVLIYDSEESTEDFLVIGGTSVASPIIASVFALAGGAHEVAYPAQTLYTHLGSASLYDVTEGGNGKCDDRYTGGCSGSLLDCGEGALICNAAHGYDGPTGVGAPKGIAAFEPLSEAEQKAEEERRAAEQKAEEEKQAAEEKQAEEEAKAANERKAAEKKQAEEERKAAERKAEEELEAAEQKRAAERKQAEEALKASQEKQAAAEGAAKEELEALERIEAEEESGGGLGGGSNASPNGHAGNAPGTGRANTGTGGSGGSVARLSKLVLTKRASTAIAHGRPTIAQVACAFTISAPARVQVTLSRRVRRDGRLRWALEPDSLTLAAAKGRHRLHLVGQKTLAAGRYRLTLTPAHGAAHSLVFYT